MLEASNMDDRMPNITFVRSDFFLNRIVEFEEKYGMQWSQFLAQYISTKDCVENFAASGTIKTGQTDNFARFDGKIDVLKTAGRRERMHLQQGSGGIARF